MPTLSANRQIPNDDQISAASTLNTEAIPMENETISLEQFITDHNLRFDCHTVYTRPDGLMDGDMRHFRCRIKAGKRSFGLYFSQGRGVTHEPTLADVLDCLASDASSYENTNEFESWAQDFGYETDSRKAEKMFRAVKRQAEQLKRALGQEAYEQLLWNTERL